MCSRNKYKVYFVKYYEKFNKILGLNWIRLKILKEVQNKLFKTIQYYTSFNIL
jgi:hypothetical protein